MMYIYAFLVAMSILASDTCDEKLLGVYQIDPDGDLDDDRGYSYLVQHLQLQVSVDLRYVI